LDMLLDTEADSVQTVDRWTEIQRLSFRIKAFTQCQPIIFNQRPRRNQIHAPLSGQSKSSTAKPHTVILGAGIIGASTAYYLTHSRSHNSDHRITILDPNPPGSGASGKSAGFITKNGTGAATAALAELSFELHSELAQKHGGAEKWGYRKCRAFSGVVKIGRGDRSGGSLSTVPLMDQVDELSWVKPGVIQNRKLLADVDASAQWY
jgi:hypothetical protein